MQRLNTQNGQDYICFKIVQIHMNLLNATIMCLSKLVNNMRTYIVCEVSTFSTHSNGL